VPDAQDLSKTAVDRKTSSTMTRSFRFDKIRVLDLSHPLLGPRAVAGLRVMRPGRGLVLLLGVSTLLGRSDGGAFGDENALDQDIAARHFQLGSEAYARSDFQRALEEFQAARRVVPRPELDFNIGRVYDRLDEPARAIEAYARYVAAMPDAPDAAEVRARIATLQDRLPAGPFAVSAAPAPADHHGSHAYVAPIVVGALALSAGAVGAGLLGALKGEYDKLHDGCGVAGTCSVAQWSGLRSQDITGKVMLGVGGALLLVDVALWVRARGRVAKENRRVAAWRTR
jgi:hypothetical protein